MLTLIVPKASGEVKIYFPLLMAGKVAGFCADCAPAPDLGMAEHGLYICTADKLTENAIRRHIDDSLDFLIVIC